MKRTKLKWFCAMFVLLGGAVVARAQDVESLITRGNERLDRSDYVGAMEDFDAVIKAAPNDVRGYLGRADVFYGQSDYDQAITAYEAAQKYDADAVKVKLSYAFNQRGHKNFNAAHWDAAISDYLEAADLVPDDSNYWANCANTQRWKGELEKAMANFEKSLDINTETNGVGYENRALLKIEMGDLLGAAADFQAAAEADYDPDYDRYYAGVCLLSAGRYDDALAQFRLAEDLDWGNSCNLHQGMCLTALGRDQEAEEQFSKFTESGGSTAAVSLAKWQVAESRLEPTTPIEFCRRAADHVTLVENSMAHIDWKRALAMDPKCVEAWNARGWRWYLDDQYGWCEWAMDQAIALRDFSLSSEYLARGYSRFMQDNAADALHDLNISLILSPKDFYALYTRGRINSKLGALEEAVADLTAALELSPDDSSCYRERALAYARMKKSKEANADMQKYKELVPDQADQIVKDMTAAIRAKPETWPKPGTSPFEVALLRAYGKHGRGLYEESITEYDALVRGAPSDPRGYMGRGMARKSIYNADTSTTDVRKAFSPELTRVLAEALDDLKRAYSLADNKDTRACLATCYEARGTAAYNRSQPVEAAAEYSEAIELAPQMWQYWYDRGGEFAKIGKIDEALEDFDRARSMFVSDSYSTIYERGLALRQAGKFDEALAEFDYLRDRGIATQVSNLNRGFTLLDMQKPEEAAEAFREVIDAGGYRAQGADASQLGLAAAFYAQGDTPRAESALADSGCADWVKNEVKALSDKWYSTTPSTTSEYANRAALRSNSGDRQGALSDWLEVLNRDSRNTDALMARCMDSWYLDINAWAVADADAILKIDDRNADAWYYKGVALQDVGIKFDEALAALDKALELGREPTAFLMRRHGQAHAALFHLDDALLDYEQVLLLNPQDVDAMFDKAYALALAGRTDEAQAACDEATQIQSEDLRAKRVKGYILMREGNFAAGQSELDTYLATFGGDRDRVTADIQYLKNSAN